MTAFRGKMPDMKDEANICRTGGPEKEERKQGGHPREKKASLK